MLQISQGARMLQEDKLKLSSAKPLRHIKRQSFLLLSRNYCVNVVAQPSAAADEELRT
jgi:hypothetical protein